MKHAFIEGHRDSYSLRLLSRAFGLSRSNHYAHSKRIVHREQGEVPVVEAIRSVHQHRFKRSYGSPRITAELRAQGYRINRKRVARLMRKEGIRAKILGRFRRTTDSKHTLPVADNLLQRDFSIGRANHKWTTDITYIRTMVGFVYLAGIIDLGTRTWVGFAVASHMRTSLCLEALEMALIHQGISPELFHADQGSQYASEEHNAALRAHGITLSMSGKGQCWDNAVTESLWGTLKTELGDTFVDLEDVKKNIFDYWLFYNRERRHSTLGYLTPETYTKQLQQQTQLVL